MASDTRQWTCPECGRKVELSILRLDPLACDECLARQKAKTAATAPSDPLKSLPDLSKFGGLLIGAFLGLVVGFAAGRWTAPTADEKPRGAQSSDSGESRSKSDADGNAATDDEPDESTRPGKNYRWVRGYTRKDGVQVKGHWAREPKK